MLHFEACTALLDCLCYSGPLSQGGALCVEAQCFLSFDKPFIGHTVLPEILALQLFLKTSTILQLLFLCFQTAVLLPQSVMLIS